MPLAALQAQLAARRDQYARQLAEKRFAVLRAEEELKRARCEADTLSGALQSMERALLDIETMPREPAPVRP